MKDLLQVVAQGGSGSAAPTLGGGLAGILRRFRRTPLLLGALAMLSLLGWDMLGDVTAPSAPRTPPPSEAAVATPPTASPTPMVAEAPDIAGRVAYSLDVGEIAGLSPTTPPGSSVELWVTWDRPLTKVPKLKLVVGDAILERVSPPVTPNGPTVATFLIARREIENLLWADQYGAISATLRLP